jgi:hypothetical protein
MGGDAAFAVFDIIDKGATALAEKEDSVSGIRNALNDSRSISSKAKDSFFMYPVLFTPGVTDIDVAFRIAKYLELQYALFTIMSIGLNPKVQGESIGDYLKAYAGESANFIDIDNVEKWEQDQIWNRAMEDGHLLKEYEFIADNYSTEAKDEENKKHPIDNDLQQTTGYTDFAKTIEKRIGNAHPTIIKSSMYMKDVANPIDVTLSIKSCPHFITGDQVAMLFDSSIEKQHLLNRIVKLTTGEIKFFRDFIFHMDWVKRDTELYSKFGEHPWYQQFMKRKAANKNMKVLNAVLGAIPGLRALVAGSNKYLPTATIVLSTDEMEHATKMKFGFLLKHEETLKQIMNELMLLGIVVYDPTVAVCNMWFNGFKQRIMVNVADMKSSGDSTAELVKLMNNMLRRGMI